MLPFPGLQWIISATLATILRYNKMAAIARVFNTNLATGAFVFAFNYWLGRKILEIESTFQMPDRVNFSFVKTIVEAGSEVYFSLLVRGFITGLFILFPSYYISLLILKRKQSIQHGQ